MLRWRLFLGTLFIAATVGLCWLDHCAGENGTVPGLWLLPVAALLTILASGEVLHLANSAGLSPVPWVVYVGNLLLLAANWVPQLYGGKAPTGASLEPSNYLLLALGVGVLLAFVGEMRRYRRPEGVMVNLAAAVLALVYVGLMFGFLVQLRMGWGIGALASLVIVVKMGDTGAYTVGRLIGRHKMSPILSPGKTIEGACGAMVFAALASWATFAWLIPLLAAAGTPAVAWWRAILYGLLVGGVGMFGDLAESMLKRAAGCKDSSRWMPGFGGMLDILDSILLAAPVAWACWAWALV
jgi:phosphatidate cytidylyltransferase